MLIANLSTRRALLAAGFLTCATLATGAAAAAPAITSLSESTLHRSGLLRIYGQSFGSSAAGSTVLIDGIGAIATTWKDLEIHAYVPEAASIGSVSVQVITPSGASNTLTLDVTHRVSDGRVLWRFTMDSFLPGRYLATAPDGTVYATDNLTLYALSPNGALLWALYGAGGGLPISLAADGTIYTWGGGMRAIDPSGTLKWMYPAPTNGSMIAGPNLGPDGNLYGLVGGYPAGGLGLFSIDPSGNLRWSNTSTLFFDTGGAPNSEIVFGALAKDRLVFGTSVTSGGGVPTLHSYSLGGALQWTQGSPCNSFPASDPFGRLILGGTANCGVSALDMDAAQVIWNAPPQNAIALDRPAVASDGTSYSPAPWTGGLFAVHSNGTSKWWIDLPGALHSPGVSKDDAVVVAGGTAAILGLDTADGSLEWQVALPGEGGFSELVWSARPSFAPDSSAAYVTSRFSGYGPGHSYVYAVNLCDQTAAANSYGAGWPGTLGVPALGVDRPPAIGSAIRLLADNSLGAVTPGLLLLGQGTASLPTGWGGAVLVNPAISLPIMLPAAGLDLPAQVPLDSSLCGWSAFAQLLQVDGGATHGVSFTPGLELLLGAP